MASSRKKLNMENIKNLKTMSLGIVIFLLFLALVSIAVGVSTGSGVGMGIGVAGFFGFGVGSYYVATDPKNQKTCNANFFTKTENVLNPAGDDADTELEISECLAQKNAEYGGYMGVWLKSNTTTSGTFDAYYISGDSDTTITLQKSELSSRGTAFIKKGTKDDPGPKVTVKSPAPSSPSA